VAGPLTIRKSTPDPKPPPRARVDDPADDDKKMLAAAVRRVFNVKPEDEKGEPLTRGTMAVAEAIDWALKNGPIAVQRGLDDMFNEAATKEFKDANYSRGGRQAVQGLGVTAGIAAAPYLASAAVAAPLATAADIAVGTAAGVGTHKIVEPTARMMGANPDQAGLAADIASFGVGIPASVYGTPRVLSAVEQGAARLGWRPGGGTPPPPPPPSAPPGVTMASMTAIPPTRPAGGVSNWPGGPGVSLAPTASAPYTHGAYVRAQKAAKKAGRWFDDLIVAAPPTKKINYKKELPDSALPHIEAHATGDLTTGENTFDVAIDSADNAVKFMHERSAQLIDATPNARLKTDPLSKAESRLAQHEDQTFLGKGVASLLERYPILRTPEKLSLKRADRIRWELSQRNRAALRENKWDIGNLRATNAEFAADEQAMIALREGVYGGLEDAGIPGVAAMRRAEGDVIEFRDVLGQYAHLGGNKIPGTGLPRGVNQAILANPTLPLRGNRALASAANIIAGKNKRNEMLARVFRERAKTPGARPTYPNLPAAPAAAPAAAAPAMAVPPATQPFRPPATAMATPASAGLTVPGAGRPAPRPAGPMVPGVGRPAPPPPPPAAPPAPPVPPPNVPGLGRPMPPTQQRPPRPTGAQAGSRWAGSPLDAEARRMGVWLNDEQLALADVLMRKYARDPQQAILTVLQKAPQLATAPPVQRQLPAPGRVLTTPPPAPTPQPPGTRVTPGAVAARDAWGRPTQFSGDPNAVDVPFPPRGPQGPFNPPPGAAPPGAPPLGPGPMGPFNPPGSVVPRGGGAPPRPGGAPPAGGVSGGVSPSATPGRVTPKDQMDYAKELLAKGIETDPNVAWERAQRERPIVNPEPAPSPEGSNVPRIQRGEAPVRPAPAAPRPAENTIDAAVARSGTALSPVHRQLADAAMSRGSLPADDIVRIVSEMSDEQAQRMLDEFLEIQRAQAEPAPRNLGGIVEQPAAPAPVDLGQSVIDEPIGSDLTGPTTNPRPPAGKKKDPVAEGRRRRPNREDHELTPGELQTRLYIEGVTLSIPQVERVQALLRAGATREDAVTAVMQGADVPDTNRLLAGGAADANALADSRPAGMEVNAGTHLRRLPNESPQALTKRRRDAKRAAFNARYIDHYRELFDLVAAHAKQVDPDVNLETLQAALDDRVKHYEELVSQYLESPDNPQLLLKEIARKGGINTEDSTFPGEVKRLLEGVKFGRFGGVEGVFRKGGKSISDIATDLTREGIRGLDNTFAHLEEQGGKLAELLDWAGANPPKYEEGVLPGSDKLRDMGVELDRPWWRSAEKPPTDADDGDALDELGDFFANPEDGGPAPSEGLLEGENDPYFQRLIDALRRRGWSEEDIAENMKARNEAAQRFREERQQQSGGEKVDILDTGEEQPRLPGAGDVRDQNIKTPEIDLPFSLSGGVSERPQGTAQDLFGNRPIAQAPLSPNTLKDPNVQGGVTIKNYVGNVASKLDRATSRIADLKARGMSDSEANAVTREHAEIAATVVESLDDAKALLVRMRELDWRLDRSHRELPKPPKKKD